MERHFALPIAIAAALHAGLLYGIRPPHVVSLPSHDEVKTIITEWVFPKDPPEQPVEESSGGGSTKSDEPEPFVPSQPEPLVPNPGQIETRLPPPSPDGGPSIDRIPIRDFGLPGPGDGIGHGPLFKRSDLDNEPRARAQVPPQFPVEARRRGLSGQVVVEFIVDETGTVIDPHVLRSTDRVFDEPTLRAVSRWRFEPGRRHGAVVRFRMALAVVFNLNDDR
jgi:protein TonB